MWSTASSFQPLTSDLLFAPPSAPEQLPHLVQFLWDRYLEDIQSRLAQRKADGKSVVDFAEAIRRAPASDFAHFAARYLSQQRAVQSFWLPDNVGLRLSSEVSVVVSPPNPQAQPSAASAVPITEPNEAEQQKQLFSPLSSSLLSFRW